ncbi:MAG: traG [Cypionkella sp.]|uniref:type IV secretory system conjugative DNA transfer family protein n=1 Tax=Cypionkella sp. TaxID=2811411 RepID=UPI002601FC68|nr:type IV secretory system conjugative DNA transfer family protein [Cypionkella sp.]MDB5660282.1 traG [Cypionkella sp.]
MTLLDPAALPEEPKADRADRLERLYRVISVLGSTGTTIRMEERPLLSETDARMMDPDKVVILASPQQPIRVSRIKYHEDPIFLALLAQSADTPLPLPPSPMLALPPPPVLTQPTPPEEVTELQSDGPTPSAVSTGPAMCSAPVRRAVKEYVVGQGAQAKPKSRARRAIAPVAPPTQIVRNPNAVPVRALFDSFEDKETLNDPLPRGFASALAEKPSGAHFGQWCGRVHIRAIRI